MVDTSLWTNIIIPTLITPFLFFIKSLWDRYNEHISEKEHKIEAHLLEITKLKLELFFWPIYIRLLKINEIESKIKIENTFNQKNIQTAEEDLSSTDEDYSDDDDNWENIKKIINNKKNNKKNSKNKKITIKIIEDFTNINTPFSIVKTSLILNTFDFNFNFSVE